MEKRALALKLLPFCKREFPRKERRGPRDRPKRQINRSAAICGGETLYLFWPLKLPTAIFNAKILACVPHMHRPTKAEIRALAALYRGTIKESRRINELARNLLTSEGRSQVPTLLDLAGPEPKRPPRRKSQIPAPAQVPPGEITARKDEATRKLMGRCDACAPLAGPFKCKVELCGGPSGDYFIAGGQRIEKKAIIPFSSDRLTEMVNAPGGPCAQPQKEKTPSAPKALTTPWRLPAGLNPVRAKPIPGMPQQPVGPIQMPAAEPGATPTPTGIPGALPGEFCVPSSGPFKYQVWNCHGAEGSFYVTQGKRRLISSFPSVDAVIAWVNGTP